MKITINISKDRSSYNVDIDDGKRLVVSTGASPKSNAALTLALASVIQDALDNPPQPPSAIARWWVRP